MNKAQLEARVAELKTDRDDARAARNRAIELRDQAEKRADNLEAEIGGLFLDVSKLEGWQSCAREFMDKTSVMNNTITGATGNGGNIKVAK